MPLPYNNTLPPYRCGIDIPSHYLPMDRHYLRAGQEDSGTYSSEGVHRKGRVLYTLVVCCGMQLLVFRVYFIYLYSIYVFNMYFIVYVYTYIRLVP